MVTKPKRAIQEDMAGPKFDMSKGPSEQQGVKSLAQKG
jgi:hypothetical protein